MICAWKTCTNETRINPYRPTWPTKYCSIECKNKAGVDGVRHKRKLKAIEYMGGKCKCGYNKCPGALHFHHVDPSAKEFKISWTSNWKKIEAELEKCVMLCSNCHAETHWDEWNPVK